LRDQPTCFPAGRQVGETFACQHWDDGS
jgi:hypothetical protein